MPSSSSARMMRIAISPRLATRTFENMWAAECIAASSAAARPHHSRTRAPSGDMQTALGAVGPRPAALAALAGHGARRAADRAIARVVQRVVGQVALDDPPPDVVLGPVDERVVLDEVA